MKANTNEIKNAKVTVTGIVYDDEACTAEAQRLECIITNDNIGKTLSINDGKKQFTIPFAYVVNDTDTFRKGIEAVKKLQDEGKTKRMPIVWELYRYLNGIDINTHEVKDDTFIPIRDETIDIDTPRAYEELKRRIENE